MGGMSYFCTDKIFSYNHLKDTRRFLMADNKYFRVAYELYIRTPQDSASSQPQEAEEVLVEQTEAGHPFEFVSGMGFTLPEFEAHIMDLDVGGAFDFVIDQDKAFGAYDESLVKHLPKEIFNGDNGHFDARTIYPGNVVPMVNEDGQQFDALVKEVNDTEIVVDFNHALAGVDLHFKGVVLGVHPASGQEITRFVNQMTGEDDHDHDHCNCHHH